MAGRCTGTDPAGRVRPQRHPLAAESPPGSAGAGCASWRSWASRSRSPSSEEPPQTRRTRLPRMHCRPKSLRPHRPWRARRRSVAPTPTGPATPTPSPTPSATSHPTPPAKAAKGTALAAAGALTVKGRAPKTGYSRDQFGQAWFDTDRNGCDTRNDILRRDLTDRDMKNSCKVLAGTRAPDPYTGRSDPFRRRRGQRDRHRPRGRPLGRLAEGGRHAGRPASAWRSPTTPWSSWRSTPGPTAPRATGTPRPGCRRTSPTAVSTSRDRSP